MNDLTSIAAELHEDDRLLVAAALGQLAANFDDFPVNPLMRRIASIRSALISDTVLSAAPARVSFYEADYQEFLGYLPVSSSWCVYVDYGDEEDLILRAEAAVPAGILTFALADGFGWAPDRDPGADGAEFVAAVRVHVASHAPETSRELVARPLELTFSWTAVESISEQGICDHVNTLAAGHDIGPFKTRGSYIDEHTNQALAEREYASLTTLVIGTPNDLEALKTILKDAETSLVTPSAQVDR